MRARVHATGEVIFVCEECETTWSSIDAIAHGQGLNFVDFMTARGLEGRWFEVERLQPR